MAMKRIDVTFRGQPVEDLDTRYTSVTGNGGYALINGRGSQLLGLPGSAPYLVNLQTGRAEAVAFTQTGDLVLQAHDAMVSADARYVIYNSFQSDIAAGDGNGANDVFRYDRVTHTTEMVSTTATGEAGNAGSRGFVISPNGRYVVFISDAKNLVTPDGTIGATPPGTQLFIRDMQTGVTTQISQSAPDGSYREEPLFANWVNDQGIVQYKYIEYSPAYPAGRNYVSQERSATWVGEKLKGGTIYRSNDGADVTSRFGENWFTKYNDPGDEDDVSLSFPSGFVGGISVTDHASGGSYLVFVSNFDPRTKAWAPGLYVWNSNAGDKDKIGDFAKLLMLRSDDDIEAVSFSADGRTIIVKTSGTVEGHAPGTYVLDNLLFSGTRYSGGEVTVPSIKPSTGEADVLIGTSLTDTISGGGGDDRIYGAAGDDQLYGDAGQDQLYGTMGDDVLHGGGDIDRLYGQDDNDKLYGDAGDDQLDGGDGKDLLSGGADNDKLYGGFGDDELYGDAGDDFLCGEGNDDELHGGSGDDTLEGGAGNDRFWLDADDDTIDGGESEDDADVLIVSGSPDDYHIVDVLLGSAPYTRIESAATGEDKVRGIEEARFSEMRHNVATIDTLYLTLAKAANVAYEVSALMGDGWKPISALELGIDMAGTIKDTDTAWTYANGYYQAVGDTGVGEVQASAQLYFGVVDGRNTLLLGVRGTDQASDPHDYFPFQQHADRLKPLIDAVLKYIEKGGFVNGGHIDRVLISGHSLGGATVQQIMKDDRIVGDPKWSGATFGSPGSENFASDPRLLHFEHTADLVPLAGDIGRSIIPSFALGLSPLLGDIDDFIKRGDVVDTVPFRTAGDVVRVGTINGIGSDPGSQHSMDNYVQTLTNMAALREFLPFMTGGTGAIPGLHGKVDVMVGSASADTMTGSEVLAMRLLRGWSYFDGAEFFVGGSGADRMTGGEGRDIFAGRLADFAGDTITDFASGEAIRVYGATLSDADLNYRMVPGTNSGTLSFGGVTITLGGIHHGSFHVVTSGAGYVDIVHSGHITLFGEDGRDVLSGGDGGDTLVGNGGNDALHGGKGSDTLFGDGQPVGADFAGMSRLAAVGGDDLLDGGEGADTYTGGGGRDVFVIGRDAADHVTDFATGRGGDVLDVSAITGALPMDKDPFVSGHLRLAFADGVTKLLYDADGRAGSGAGVVVATLADIDPDALIPENFWGGGMPMNPLYGQTAIVGTDQRDFIQGSGGRDVILGLHGNDVILAGGGNDIVYAGYMDYERYNPYGTGEHRDLPAEHAGRTVDYVDGGGGNDTIYTGFSDLAHSEVHGGTGDDTLVARYGHSRLYGEDGDDVIDMREGYHEAWGGSGADTYVTLRGTVHDFDLARDRIDLTGTGIAAFEQIRIDVEGTGTAVGGAIGKLLLNGVSIRDLTAQNFIFDVVETPDVQRGTANNDVIVVGKSSMEGSMLVRVDDGGQDRLVYSDATGPFGPYAVGGRYYFGATLDASDRIDRSELGRIGHSTIIVQGNYTGTNAIVIDRTKLQGLDAIELLSGGDARFGRQGGANHYAIRFAQPEENIFEPLEIDASSLRADETISIALDTILGSLRIQAGAADDLLYGGKWDDRLGGNGGTDTLFGGDGDDELSGGAGVDWLHGGADNDLLSGDAGNDELFGGGGADALIGGAGADRLSGGAGDDYLNGSDHTADALVISSDVLDGGTGKDTLVASSGALMTGGADSDTFVLNRADVRQVSIMDFEAGPGGDVLDLTGLLAAFADLPAGGDAIGQGYLRLRTVGGDTLVEVDPGLTGTFATIARIYGVSLAALDALNVRGFSLPGIFVEGSPDATVLTGGTGSDTLNGSAVGELFRLEHGGHDHASGGGGNDGFYFGGALDNDDVVDGGSGSDDQLALQGNYGGTFFPHVFGARNLVNVETLVLLSGRDTRFGAAGTGSFAYDLKTIDANVALGSRLLVTMTGLRADEAVTFDGSSERDGSFTFYGGQSRDTLIGGAGADGFYFGTGGTFGVQDFVVGGAGDDQLGLQGNYTVVFGAGQVQGIETIVLLGVGDKRFGGAGQQPFQYDLTLHDDMVTGGTLSVNANTLRADEGLRLDASAEHDGTVRVFGGGGADTLIGGSGADDLNGGGGNDVLRGGGGADRLNGGDGADRFLVTAAESSGRVYDTIVGFDALVDTIDVAGVAGDYRFVGTTSAIVSSGNIDVNLAAAVVDTLGAHDFALVKATGGDLKGTVFVVVDQNGVAGYQPGEDVIVALTGAANLSNDTAGFIV